MYITIKNDMDLFWKIAPLFLIIIMFIFIWLNKRFKYWRNKNVRGPKPSIFFGNIKEVFAKKLHMGEHFKNLYDVTKNEPFVGIYMLYNPAILVNNLDLIRMILVKDFAHFTDHGFEFNTKTQPLVNHLFNLNGSKWRGVRTKLTPAFTSSKMKYMFETIAVCGEEFRKYAEIFAISGDDIDMKEAAAKFSTDVIVSCAFGIDSNSFKHPDAEFRNMGKRLFNFNLRQRIMMFLVTFAPGLQKLLNLRLMDKDIQDFFVNVIERTVQYREDNNVTRNDLLQLLIRLKNNENIDDYSSNTEYAKIKDNESTNVQLTTMEITAQAFGFYGAGFEASSTTTSFIFYQLAKHPEIQKKVINEIDEILAMHENKITYEAVNSMKYVGQVIDETLRIHPTVPVVFRKCTKEYVIPNTSIVIEKGTPLYISALGIHKDPNIYPDPEKFDPDRFSSENKALRSNYTFLGFGEGPRSCIGNRFALLQIRIAMVYILQNYQVSLNTNKKNAFEVGNNNFLMVPKTMNLKLSKRYNY